MTTLLIDGDILAYRAAAANQETVVWGEDEPEDIVANLPGAIQSMEHELRSYYKAILTDDEVICLSDDRNWRKELWPQYKAHRAEIVRPVLLGACKDYLRAHYRSETWSRLEADDVMGILGTTRQDTVIVSIDKDMRTVPARLFNPNNPDVGAVKISPTAAFRSHMLQTLTGDSSDGYKGCPGIGPKKAEAILDNTETTPEGDFEKWKRALWQNVLATFLEKDLSEAEALLNARLANILTQGQYKRETAKVRLWLPPVKSS